MTFSASPVNIILIHQDDIKSEEYRINAFMLEKYRLVSLSFTFMILGLISKYWYFDIMQCIPLQELVIWNKFMYVWKISIGLALLYPYDLTFNIKILIFWYNAMYTSARTCDMDFVSSASAKVWLLGIWRLVSWLSDVWRETMRFLFTFSLSSLGGGWFCLH